MWFDLGMSLRPDVLRIINDFAIIDSRVLVDPVKHLSVPDERIFRLQYPLLAISRSLLGEGSYEIDLRDSRPETSAIYSGRHATATR